MNFLKLKYDPDIDRIVLYYCDFRNFRYQIDPKELKKKKKKINF